jgi:hypothetical protein
LAAGPSRTASCGRPHSGWLRCACGGGSALKLCFDCLPGLACLLLPLCHPKSRNTSTSGGSDVAVETDPSYLKEESLSLRVHALAPNPAQQQTWPTRSVGALWAMWSLRPALPAVIQSAAAAVDTAVAADCPWHAAAATRQLLRVADDPTPQHLARL